MYIGIRFLNRLVALIIISWGAIGFQVKGTSVTEGFLNWTRPSELLNGVPILFLISSYEVTKNKHLGKLCYQATFVVGLYQSLSCFEFISYCNKCLKLVWLIDQTFNLLNIDLLNSASLKQINSLIYLLHGLQRANAFDGPVFLKGSPRMPTYTKRLLQGCNIVWWKWILTVESHDIF